MFFKQIPPPHIRLFRRECIELMETHDFDELMKYMSKFFYINIFKCKE